MKFLKFIISSSFLFITTGMLAQNISNVEHDVMRTTKKKIFTPKNSTTKKPIRLKILERRDYKFAFDENDEGKTDQDRVMVPAYVTKVVYVDSDSDKYYDKYMVIRYDKSYEDKFEIVATETGLGLKIDDEVVQNIDRAGFYATDTKDNDYFVVEEFRSI